jgi:hypothetical protein
MGDFLVKELNGQGNIWSFVDLAGHSEDTHGCNGPIQASREPTLRSSPRKTATSL